MILLTEKIHCFYKSVVTVKQIVSGKYTDLSNTSSRPAW